VRLADIIAGHSFHREGRVITARKRQPILYDPDFAIKEHVSVAAGKLHGHFASDSVSGKPIRKSLSQLVEDARLLGFEDGAHYSGKKLTDSYAKKVAAQAKEYARTLASQVAKTTRTGLKNETPYVTTSDRALSIAKHEGRKAYNRGLLEAMGGHGFGKSWVTGDNPCNDCTDNEDDDVIDMEEMFSSGDTEPPAHPNCSCTMGVHV
jgi:hypothetical protein